MFKLKCFFVNAETSNEKIDNGIIPIFNKILIKNKNTLYLFLTIRYIFVIFVWFNQLFTNNYHCLLKLNVILQKFNCTQIEYTNYNDKKKLLDIE